MISRYLFVCLYFVSFFLVNRLLDFSKHRTLTIEKISIKQLKDLLHRRGLSFIHLNEKNELIKLIEQTGDFQIQIRNETKRIRLGSVREDELEEPIEEMTNVFTSYKQMIDTIDDCKESIW